MIARLLSSTAVGLFSMAQGLTEAPTRLSTAIINQISLPVFAKLQHDRVQLTAYFLKISKYLTVVSLPIQIGLALVAPRVSPAAALGEVAGPDVPSRSCAWRAR